ncbi:hypothetical protein E1301_Tti000259 [Triplophysa tibetana]|uniref:Uncharacterized protein n=1 Tax=Triplophysa tibetana TaxID=1572043 RepID=A0A5A9N5A1_9TELE|nr:hypothetical protein E1301_Tti000259 [Triplophysa tibetana]
MVQPTPQWPWWWNPGKAKKAWEALKAWGALKTTRKLGRLGRLCGVPLKIKEVTLPQPLIHQGELKCERPVPALVEVHRVDVPVFVEGDWILEPGALSPNHLDVPVVREESR